MISPVSSLKGVSLRKYRQLNGTDSRCFAAEICVDGVFAGTVHNDGNDGDHDYCWGNKECGSEFYRRVNAWARETSYFLSTPEDAFIDAILRKIEDERICRRNLKRRCPVTARCRKGRTVIPLGNTTQTVWTEEFYAGFSDVNQLSKYVHEKDVEDYEIISEAVSL